MNNLRPVEDKLLIKKHESRKQSVGGILIPDSAQAKSSTGTVLCFGPGKLRQDGGRTPLDVQFGDTIHFSPYASTEIEVDHNKYLIISWQDVLAVEPKGY